MRTATCVVQTGAGGQFREGDPATGAKPCKRQACGENDDTSCGCAAPTARATSTVHLYAIIQCCEQCADRMGRRRCEQHVSQSGRTRREIPNGRMTRQRPDTSTRKRLVNETHGHPDKNIPSEVVAESVWGSGVIAKASVLHALAHAVAFRDAHRLTAQHPLLSASPIKHLPLTPPSPLPPQV